MKLKIILLFLLPILTFAQIPEYYNTIDFTQSGDNLKNQLTTLITNTHTTQVYYTSSYYTDTWDVIEASDLDPVNTQNVLLIYGYDDTDTNLQNDRTRDYTLSCHTSSCTGLWTREHVYAQSLATPPLDTSYPSAGTDVHNLRSIDSGMNSSRNNRLFEDSSGNSHIISSSGRFYPGDEWKGDIARIIMYMYVRYPIQCIPLNIAFSTTNYAPNHDMMDVVLDWNEEDPVSQFEINRNNQIYNVQGNRNPFIDNPYLATMIWNGPEAEDTWQVLSVLENDLSLVNIYPTLTDGIIHITNQNNHITKYTVYNTLGQLIKNDSTNDLIDISNNPKGVYFINLQFENQSKTFKVFLN